MLLTRLVVCVAGLLSIGASALAQDATKVLKVIPSADVAELDPTRANNQIGRIYAQMVFDTLFALDHNLAPKPMMVDKEVVSPDRLTYTFTLRPGLKFQDGTQVTTRDVIASLNRWMQGGSVGPQLKARLASMNAIDDASFTLTLKQPFGLVEFALAGPGAPMAAIMREADANRPDGVKLTDPVGSGPFRYVASERIAGQRVVFERNPDYPARPEPPDGLAGGRIVKVDRVEWNIIPDPATAANALITGEADFWDTATTDMVPFLKSHGISAQRTATLPAVGFIRTNFQAPPFNDPRARQALALIFDQKDFMAAVAGDNVAWQSCYSYSVCGSVLGTEIGSDAYRHPDLAKAKQLLTEAGYHGEKVVVVSSPQLPIVAALAQVAAQRMHDAGINVSLQMGDWANVFSEVTSRARAKGPDTWNVFASYSLGGTWFHPLTNVALDLSCEGSVMGFPCDPEDEALRQKVLSAPDDAARKSSFEAFQRQMWQFIPYVPVGQFDIDNAWRKNISGVLTSYVIAYWNIEKH